MDCASSQCRAPGCSESTESSEEIHRWPGWPHFRRKGAVGKESSPVPENPAYKAWRIIWVEVHLICFRYPLSTKGKKSKRMVVTLLKSVGESNAYAETTLGIWTSSILSCWVHASSKDPDNDAYLFLSLMDATDLVYFQGQVRSKEASTVEQ